MNLAYKEKFGLPRERTKIQVTSKSSCVYISGFVLYISDNVIPPRFLLDLFLKELMHTVGTDQCYLGATN